MMNSRGVSVVDAHDMKALGEMLSQARAGQGLTQRQVATKTGIPQGKISRIERGATAVPAPMLAQFASAVGQTLQLVMTPLPDETAGEPAQSERIYF